MSNKEIDIEIDLLTNSIENSVTGEVFDTIVKEPKGVDFVVKSEPWTEKELKEFRKLMKKQKSELGEKSDPRSKRIIKRFPNNRHSLLRFYL